MSDPHAVILTSPGVHDLFSLINVGVVALVVIVFARKGIQQSFKGRSQKIREDLVLAREELKKISQDIESARKQLAEIEKEKAALISKVEEEGKLLAQKLLDEAKQSAARIREDSGRAVTAEFAEMREKLKEELMSSLMIKVADDFSSESSKQKLHDKLIESFLSNAGNLANDLQSMNKEGALNGGH